MTYGKSNHARKPNDQEENWTSVFQNLTRDRMYPRHVAAFTPQQPDTHPATVLAMLASKMK